MIRLKKIKYYFNSSFVRSRILNRKLLSILSPDLLINYMVKMKKYLKEYKSMGGDKWQMKKERLLAR